MKPKNIILRGGSLDGKTLDGVVGDIVNENKSPWQIWKMTDEIEGGRVVFRISK